MDRAESDEGSEEAGGINLGELVEGTRVGSYAVIQTLSHQHLTATISSDLDHLQAYVCVDRLGLLLPFHGERDKTPLLRSSAAAVPILVLDSAQAGFMR